jgi:Chaperone of endosialidase/Head domain of trimeric autotransporter adhesin
MQYAKDRSRKFNNCLAILIILMQGNALNAQNVGIGTTNPQARLHVTDSNIVFSAGGDIPGTPGNVPVSGAGRRMMWYPDKAAFRAGYVDGLQWNKDSIGSYSIAAGYLTKAKGFGAVALGNKSVASGQNSVALGADNLASGGQSIAIGNFTTASGENSAAMGNHTIASNDYSSAMGIETRASGIVSTAMGAGTTASGGVSTSMGSGTTASGYASTAMGNNTTAKASGSLAIGFSNDSTDNPDPIGPAPADRIFQIGNGSLTSTSNALTVLRNGNTGIGVTNPNATLEAIRGTGNGGTAIFSGTQHASHFNYSTGEDTYIRAGKDNRSVILNDIPGGRVGIGVTTPLEKLHVQGNICYTGSIGACSDIRYKKDFTPIGHALQTVLSLNGFYYYWKHDEFTQFEFSKKRQLGFSAQEIEKFFPELVLTNANGYRSVDYGRLTPVLVEAVKEQQKQIDDLLKDKIEMQTQLAELKKMVEKLINK